MPLAPLNSAARLHMTHIEHVRVPDEIRFAAKSVCERFPKIASLAPSGEITLKKLTPVEKVALDFILLPGLVDEIIDNINIVLSDLEVLGASARAFSDNHPFRRYKLLVRTFFYEFGRFEDAFGYCTLWMQRRGYITKSERRAMRDDFFHSMEPMVKIRNICLHDNPDWSKHLSPEIIILKSLDLFGLQVEDKQGETLKWEPHLGPQCKQMQSMIYTATSEMRVTWNMHFSECAQYLIKDKKLKPSPRRFTPKNLTRTKVRSHHGKMGITGGES